MQQGANDYLLANPRLVEAHNFDVSTVVPCIGPARSSPRPFTVDNLPYSQHLRVDTYEGAGRCQRMKAEDAGRDTKYEGAGRGVGYKDEGAGVRRRNKAKEEWPGTCKKVKHIMREG